MTNECRRSGRLTAAAIQSRAAPPSAQPKFSNCGHCSLAASAAAINFPTRCREKHREAAMRICGGSASGLASRLPLTLIPHTASHLSLASESGLVQRVVPLTPTHPHRSSIPHRTLIGKNTELCIHIRNVSPGFQVSH